MAAPFRCECGRPIVITRVGKDRGTRTLRDHDLCRQCWRSRKDSDRAATAPPRVDRDDLLREKQEREAYRQRGLQLKRGG